MNIYLDSLSICAAPDGVRVRYEPRAEIKRRYDKTLMSSVTSSRGYVRVWEITTPELLATDVDQIRTVLEGPGGMSLSGDLLSSGSVQVYPRNINRIVSKNQTYAALSFELWGEAVIADERKELIRFWVADESDVLQNLSAWFVSATVQASIEAFAKTASIVLWRETPTESKAPLMQSSPDVYPGRRVKMDSAIIGLSETVEEADWEPLFIGRIDDTNWGGNASQIVLPCRDGAGILHDVWIKEERVYGDNVVPPTLESQMVALIADNMSSPTPQLIVEGDPNRGILLFTQKIQTLQDGLFGYRDIIGWDLREMWNASLQDFVLTLYEPDRTKTTPDHTFDLNDYFEITGISLSALGVRNYIEVKWDADQPSVVVEDTNSKSTFATADFDGYYYLRLDETQNAQINTQALALAYAQVVLEETAFPALSHTALNAFYPQIELNNLVRYPANNIHYDSQQDLAVIGYTHEIKGDGSSTSIQGRGAPRGSVTRWYTKGEATQRKQEIDRTVEDPPTLEERLLWLYTKGTGPGYAAESVAATSLGGWISKTEVAAGLYGVFREVLAGELSGGITIHRSVAIVNIETGPEARDFECVLGFLSPDAGGSGSYEFAIRLDPAGSLAITSVAQQSAISANEETAPNSVPAIDYVSPLDGESGVLDLGTISPGYGRIIHLRLTVLPGAVGQFTGEALVLQDQVPAES